MPKASALNVLTCAIFGVILFGAPAAAKASPHAPYDGTGYWGYAEHPHHHGCFVTLSPTDYTRGIRHWRNPCPYRYRKDMNPYHRGYHRLYPHH